MTLTIEVPTNMRVTQCSLSFMFVGTDSDFHTNIYELNPIHGGGAFTVNSYTFTEEGYRSCESVYVFRNDNWYLYSYYDGRDCDGQHSSEGEFLWDGGKWVKLGRLRVRDYTAESMGY